MKTVAVLTKRPRPLPVRDPPPAAAAAAEERIAHDLFSWSTAVDLNAKIDRLWRRLVPPDHAQRFTHPDFARVRTVFDEERHEYWVDGVLRAGAGCPSDQRWYSPSALMHHLWPEFNSEHVSSRSAARRAEGLLKKAIVDGGNAAHLRHINAGESDMDLLDLFVVTVFARRTVPGDFWARLGDSLSPGQRASALPVLRDLEVCAAAADGASAAAPWPRDAREAWQATLLGALKQSYRDEWDDARRSGQQKHAFYEDFFKSGAAGTANRAPLGFFRAMAKLAPRYWLVASEVPIFNEEHELLGCVDFILQDRLTGEFVLGDYKNCKDDDLQHSRSSNGGHHPFSARLRDAKANHYRFQLSMYREILNRYYFPGRFQREMLMLNFIPLQPMRFDEYWMEPLDLAPFFARFLPFRPRDPCHTDFVGVYGPPLLPTAVVAGVTLAEGAALGRTRRMRLPLDPAPLPANAVWVSGAYTKHGLPPSPFAHPWKWIDACVPPAAVAGVYEAYLLTQPELLRRVPSLVGKILVCWCPEDAPCHADVLVKYANLFAAKRCARPSAEQIVLTAPQRRPLLAEEDDRLAKHTPVRRMVNK